MKIHAFTAMFAMLLLASSAWADDKELKLESKPTEFVIARGVDFGRGFALSFDSLDTLGVRIDQARKMADPVGLASTSVELAAAEKASGKTIAIKSADLKKEALELAKLRSDAAELTAVQALLGADLAAEIKAAAKTKADAIAAKKDGESPRGIFQELIVDNGSEVHVDVYVDGRYVGCLEPYGHGHFPMHVHGDNVLDARGPGHRWHTHVHGDHNVYSWRLLDRQP